MMPSLDTILAGADGFLLKEVSGDELHAGCPFDGKRPFDSGSGDYQTGAHEGEISFRLD